MTDDLALRLAVMRRRVLFIVAAALVPALLLAMLVVGYDYYQRERQRELLDSLGTARAMAAAVQAELNGVKAALFALGTSPLLAADDFAGFHAQATAALKDQKLANVALLGPDLRQKLNTFRPYGTPLPARGGPESLKLVFSTGEPVVTDLFVGPLVKQPLVAVGVPIRRDGDVRYLLGGALTPERLSNILAQQHLPRGWIAAIFDGSGTIVARTHDAARFVGQKGAADLVQRMASAAEGTVETRTLEGIPVVSVFSHTPGSDWSVAIGIPLAYFSGQLVYSLAQLFIVGFMMLVVALAAAFLIARRMTT